jgi:hypothetical protein
LSDTITSGARHEFSSGKYPEDTFAFQAVTLDGRAVLELSLSEGSGVFAETVLTLPQLAEFARSMVAALYQVSEVDEANRYKWITDILTRGVTENPFETAGDGS